MKHISAEKTRRHLREALVGVVAASACSAGISALLAQSSSVKTQPAAKTAAGSGTTADPFKTSVQPFLSGHCYGCHSGDVPMAGLNLAVFTSGAMAEKKPDVWGKVLDKLKAGKMPPPGQPVPAKAEMTPAMGWMEGFLASVNSGKVFDPGRVTARRLNRVEYDNTIRDLLGVGGHPSKDFPVDDSGYGFDNNGDILSVSPLLMEKYMAAARSISQRAVFGNPFPAKPGNLIRLLNRRSPDADDVLQAGNAGIWLPYSLRGAMYGNWTFPVDAEYEFRLRVANFRGDTSDVVETPEEKEKRAEERRKNFAALRSARQKGLASGAEAPGPTPEQLKARDEAARKAAPPRKLILAVDGSPILTSVVEGNGSYGYSNGELTARVKVKAGEHFLRASFPELADLADPQSNINPDKRRGLFVDYLEIVGPYNASTEPPASYKKLFICGHAPGGHNSQCARIVVSNLMERAWRRPVTQQELAAKLSLVAIVQKDGQSFEEGVRLAAQAILSSPDFLFRIERDPKPVLVTPAAAVTRPAGHYVDDYELASRLSYYLWATMPDDELYTVAKTGKLRQPEVLEAQVRRMLASPKSQNLVDNWASQWLQLRNLGRTKPDPKRFPNVDDELLDAMRRETSLFVTEIVQKDRSLLDFIDAPFTYLNGPLARHYGIAGVDGEEFQRVTLDGERRGGVLTQGSILTVSSYPTRTSPPVRGKWVLENLLGAAPPPPPDNVPALNDSNIGTEISMKERFAQHRRDPSCSPCHNVMDPIGFGLENYDAVGRWRDADGKFPIETTGQLPGGKTFTGSKGLKEILRARSDEFVHNVTVKMFTYALGRGLEHSDDPTVDSIVQSLKARNYKFSSLVLEVVRSKQFQMRSGDAAKNTSTEIAKK
ncbi:MAG: DUF1592 domain-containing protein [Terriglobia bacterium]